MELDRRSDASPWLGLVTLLVLAGCITRAVTKIALIDNGWFVQTMEGNYRPLVDRTRVVYHLLRLPTAIATRMTDDLALLSYIYSGSLSAIPFVAVACVLWAVPRNRTDASAVALSGIVLLSLPALLYWTSAHVVLSQLYWLLIICVVSQERSRVARWAIPVLGAALFFFHPFVAVLFAGTGVSLLVLSNWRTPDRYLFKQGMLFLAAAGARARSFCCCPTSVSVSRHPTIPPTS